MHHPPTTRPRRRGRLAAIIGALALVMTTLPAQLAAAAPSNYTRHAGVHHGIGDGYWMGSFKARNGTNAEKAEIAFCALNLDEYPPDFSNVTYGNRQTTTTWVAHGAGSVTKNITGAKAARMAYVLSRWGATTNNSRAKAIYWLLHNKGEVPRGDTHMSAAQKALAAEMWAAAVKEAGPYTLEVNLVPQLGGSVGGGLVTLPNQPKQRRITYGISTGANSTDAYLEGQTIVLKINGDATWGTAAAGNVSADGKTLTVQSAKTLRERVINATGNGQITITAEAKNVYEHRFHYRNPPSSDYQRIWLAGEKQNLSTSLNTRLAGEWDYAITTTARNTSTGTAEADDDNVLKIAPGTLVADRIKTEVTSGAWPAGASTTLTSTLYGPLNAPPAERTDAPANTPVAFESYHVINGAGTFTTTSRRIDTPGWYTYDEYAPAIDGFTTAWNGTYGLTRETVLIPWSPTVLTEAGYEPVVVSSQDTYRVRDKIRVFEGRPGTSITATARLYHHGATRPSQQATVPTGVTLITTQTANITLNASGYGEGFTPWHTLPATWAEGFYTWVVSLPATDWSNAYTSPYGVESETFPLERSQGQPEIRTLTSDQVAEPGAMIHDTLLVDARNADLATYPLTVESRLFGPFDEPSAERNQWFPRAASWDDWNEFLVGSVTTTGIDSTGTHQTPSLEVPARGWYVWLWAHRDALGGGTRDGSTEYDAAQDWRVYADEITLVPWQPQVTTQTSAQRAEPGAQITDTLHVTGARPGHELTITSTLYGPLTEIPAVSATVPSGTPAVGTVLTQVTPDANGEATVVTDPITVGAPGVYVWHETITENLAQGYEGWSAPFGVASETTVVPWTPQVTTQTSHAVAEVGTELTDFLEVTGLRPGATLDVVSTLYGPFAQAPELSADVPTDAPVAGTVTTQVTGDLLGRASVQTDPVTLNAGGYYVWHETIEGSDLEHPWSAPFGVASETTLVPWSPQVTTQTSQAVVTPGTELFDTLTVTGARPDALIAVVSTLYGPFEQAPELSDEIPIDAQVAGEVVTLVRPDQDGTATVDTETVTVEDVGYYVWHETIAPDLEGTWNWWIAPFGVASETTLSQWAPTVVTQTSQAEVFPGAFIHDQLTVSGLPEGAQVKVNTSLYGPFDQAPELADAVPEGLAPIATVTTDVTGVAPTWVPHEETDGVGTWEPTPLHVTTPEVMVDDTGYYVWHETIDATDITQSWTALFAVAEETTLVTAPADEDDGGSDEDDGGDGGDDGGDDDLPETGIPGLSTLLLGAVGAIILGTWLWLVARPREDEGH